MSAPPARAGVKRHRSSSAASSMHSKRPHNDLPFELSPPSLRPLESYLKPVKEAARKREIQTQVCSLINGDYRRSSDKFPGPLPATVGRTHLQLLKSELFWVTEKSDGERKLLFADDEGVFLIDRKWNIDLINSPFYDRIFKNRGITLIDGELMCQKHTQAAFYAYDAVCVLGRNVSSYPFGERLKSLDPICAQYASLASGDSQIDHPLRLETKFFVEHSQIIRILSKIHAHNLLGYRFVDILRKRVNKNDGLIFVADADSFRPQRTTSLLKWKWPDKNTIDFKIRSPFYNQKGQLELLSGGYSKRDIMVRRLDVNETIRDQVRQWTEGKNEVVVECAYDCRIGSWKLCNPRYDKRDANHITTVISTMESMVDNVTKDDLRRAGDAFMAAHHHHHAKAQIRST